MSALHEVEEREQEEAPAWLRAALALRSGRRLTQADEDAAVAHAVAGIASGHRWRRCSSCGQEALMADESDRGCWLTFGCAGRMLEPAPMARKAHGERPADPVCRRPGCGRLGAYRTLRAERVCGVCLAELVQRTSARP